MTIENGTTLPTIAGRNLAGDAVDVATMGRGNWTVVLLYRGHW